MTICISSQTEFSQDCCVFILLVTYDVIEYIFIMSPARRTLPFALAYSTSLAEGQHDDVCNSASSTSSLWLSRASRIFLRIRFVWHQRSWRQPMMLLLFTFHGCFIFYVQDTPQVELQCAHSCHLPLICSDLVITARRCLVPPSIFYLCGRCSHLTTDSLGELFEF